MSPARPVYSTGPDGARSSRGDRAQGGASEPATDLEPDRHAVRVRLERSGRKGKQVTVAGPLILRRESAKELLKLLRKQCGTGGTLKACRTRDGDPAFDLELQGDHAEPLVAELQSRGYPTKR